MKIRPIENTERDMAALTKLMNQWDDLPAPLSSEYIKEKAGRLKKSGFAEILLCFDDAGIAIGYTCLTEVIFLGMDPFVEVQSILVDSSARRSGAGRMLMKAAEEWASGRGTGMVCLSSQVQRTGAHEFYKSLGYAVYKESKFFFRKF